MKNKNLSYKYFVIIFMLMNLLFLGFHLCIKDKRFSELENRYLSKFPTVSLENIYSGKFSEDFEDYFQDHFPFRDLWINLKSDLEKIQLKHDNNGVYYGKNDFLFEKFKVPGPMTNSNVEHINKFAENLPDDFPVSFMLVPNSLKVYEDFLPRFAPVYDQSLILEEVGDNLKEKINYINPLDLLKSSKSKNLYFKTDHHWTSIGAYYGYKSLLMSKDISAAPIENFSFKTLSDDFYGTLHAKSGSSHIPADSILAPDEKIFGDVKIEFNNSDEIYDSLYFRDNLLKKDKYTVFLNGNNPQLKITTSNKSGRKILVIKDSYAHSMLPYLTLNYSEIHVVDPRYYKVDLFKYIEENNIDETLFLYNVSNFTEDHNLQWINYTV